MNAGELTWHLSSSYIYIAYTFILFAFLCSFADELTKSGRIIERVYICMFNISIYAYMFLYVKYFVYALSLNIDMFLCDAWVKGELPWSLSLIHANITLWVLSSSKRVRLLAQRPITLVLMMINSCSYSTNDLVFIKF